MSETSEHFFDFVEGATVQKIHFAANYLCWLVQQALDLPYRLHRPDLLFITTGVILRMLTA